MKIGIDIRPLMDKEYSGVSWYTLDLLTEILKQDRQNEYVLYYNSGRDIASRISKVGIRKSDKVEIFATHYPNKLFNYFLQKICHWPKLNVIASGAKRSEAIQRLAQETTGLLLRPGRIAMTNVNIFWSPHLNFSSFSRNCQVVLTIHDLSFLAYPEFFSARQNLWHKFLGVRKLVERADMIIAISENTKQDIVRFFAVKESKIKVIYSGVGEEFRPIALDDLKVLAVKNKYELPEKFILNLGAFEPRKNIASLVRAFDTVAGKPAVGDWHLVLAGSNGWKNKEIFKAIARAKNKERIKVIGYVEKNERAALYNLAGIFAYLSFYEGFGLPVLEAMACGTPVITSNTSALPEVAGDAAVLIDPNDERSLELGLTALISSEELRKIYSARGEKRAKMFSWEKTAREYLEIFNFRT